MNIRTYFTARKQDALESESRLWSYYAHSLAMSDPDPKTTLREFREYIASSYVANHKIAGRIGVRVKTFADWLIGYREPTGKSLSKLR